MNGTSMIVEERIAAYLRALEPDMPRYLEELEKNAVAQEVPIIRKDAQALLRFLLRARRPKRILELGTAVGFSCMYMGEYMPQGARIATVEKVAMRICPAKENLKKSPRAQDIALLIGDASDVLRRLVDGDTAQRQGQQAQGLFQNVLPEKYRMTHGTSWEVYLPAGESSVWQDGAFFGSYDFIFMDAAKGQYMNFLPYILKLLAPDGMFVTDNVLQEGSIAESKFAVERRDRTIHMRMREYLYELTHREGLNTAVLPVGDGMALTTLVREDGAGDGSRAGDVGVDGRQDKALGE